MTVSIREAFKLGFLQRCSEEKLSPDQIELRIKQAKEEMAEMLGTPGDTIMKQLKQHPWLAAGSVLGAGVALPVLGGIGLGHLTRKLQGDFLDPEDVRKQELINEMQTLAQRSQHSQSKALGL